MTATKRTAERRRRQRNAGPLSVAFGHQSPVAGRTLAALTGQLSTALETQPSGPAAAGLHRWQQSLAEIGTSVEGDRGEPLRTALVKHAARLKLPDVDPAAFLFTLQTYYALLTKLLAARVVQSSRGMSATPADLRQLLHDIDRGRFFADRGIRFPACDDLFTWPGSVWSDALADAVERIGAELAELPLGEVSGDQDLLRPVYEDLLPRRVRHRLGEYYTPAWLVRHVLDCVGYHGEQDRRLIDPACGSGAFLIEAVARIKHSVGCVLARTGNSVARTGNATPASPVGCVLARTENATPATRGTLDLFDCLSRNLCGVDLNPLAILSARANLLAALGQELHTCDAPLDLQLHCGDSIRPPEEGPRSALDQSDLGEFDFVVGNPPWIGWETLSPDLRETTRPLWEHYGLFLHRGMAAILGSGKKDLSMLMAYAASDRWLKRGGRLGFVITQSVFKSAGAGQGFRRFELPGEPLCVERVDDLTELSPFDGAATRTSTFVWTKGEPTRYPLPYMKWTAEEREELAARPVDAGDVTSPWLTVPREQLPAVESLLGPSDYRAFEGVNTGGANAVFWLRVLEDRGSRLLVENITAGAKRKVPRLQAEVESTLVYPLLRGGEIARWSVAFTAHVLLAQDPQTRRGIDPGRMQAEFPLALAYLQRFEQMLRGRAAFRRYFQRNSAGRTVDAAAFYSMFNVSPQTLSPWKVAWHRMRSPIQAAVVGIIGERPTLPQETLCFVPCECQDEAHYLAGLLNSRLFNLAATSCSQSGGKGFASPHLLKHLRLPEFDEQNETHRQLAKLSHAAHHAATTGGDDLLQQLQHNIDTTAAAAMMVPPA